MDSSQAFRWQPNRAKSPAADQIIRKFYFATPSKTRTTQDARNIEPLALSRRMRLTALRRLSIIHRLVACFGAITLLLVALAIYGASELKVVDTAVSELTVAQAKRLQLVRDWRLLVAVNAQRILALALSGEPSLSKRFGPEMAADKARIDELLEQYGKMATDSEGSRLLTAAAEVRSRYLGTRDDVLSAKARGDAATLDSAVGAFMDAQKAYIAAADEMVDYELARSDSLAGRVSHSVAATRTALLVATVVCSVAALTLGLVLGSSIVRPLNDLKRAAETVAKGDLTQSLTSEGNDEVASVMRSMTRMQQALKELVVEIRTASADMAQATSEVAAGAQSLSERTERGASSLQETASAVEQLSSNVQDAASVSKAAHGRTEAAAKAAEAGTAAVGQVTEKMHAISAHASEIASISGVIESIAFQTNILALNAAVEAARAGENGRGFAVVASEVRSLAFNASASAKQIRSLTSRSVEDIEIGVELAEDACQVLRNALQETKDSAALVHKISESALEQADGIKEINIAITSLDQGVQQDAALAEQSTAAADSLRQQAEALLASVKRFRTEAAT